MRLLWLIIVLAAPSSQASERLLVAVAANFRATLEQLNPAFETRHSVRIDLSSAATGVLYNQIRHGAPFHLLVAADSERPLLLEQAGLGSERTCYARGRLALVGGDGRLAQLAEPRMSLAIANPALAPYGAAASEVLARPEFRTGAARQLLTATNVVQAYQFWHSGGADLALVPLSLAPGQATEVPANWHRVIEQQALLLRAGARHPHARRYLEWLRSDAVAKKIQTAGYGACP